MKRAFALVAWAMVPLFMLSPAQAQELRAGIMGGDTSVGTWTESRCPAGTYLTGIGEKHTDRIVGFAWRCTHAREGGWAAGDSGSPDIGPGQFNNPGTHWDFCPQDYFIVGLNATRGTYAGDPQPREGSRDWSLIADLQPVCKSIAIPPAVYQTSRSYFEQAEDNRLVDIAWGGQGSPTACPNGKFAVGITFFYSDKPGQDPANAFRNAALICDSVHVVPIKKVSEVQPTP